MTNPSIPPCPACGVVPPLVDGVLEISCCDRGGKVTAFYELDYWTNYRTAMILGRALRTHGIHTIPQLTERLAPDPRVAVWTELADYIDSCIGEAPDELTFVLNPFDSAEARGIETGKKACRDYIRQLIAAQRGEG